jgi:hypothetical protein
MRRFESFSGTESSNPPRPPRRLRATLSPPGDQPTEAQGFGRFRLGAVDLARPLDVRNSSLTGTFLLGC